MNYKKTVIVATDEPFAALGATAYLAANAEFDLLCVCGTRPELTAALTRLQPDVLVFGLALENDLNSLRELQRASPRSSVILWMRDVTTELAHQAVNLSVRGFLSTTASPEHFKQCLSIAARGELWMEQSLTMSLLEAKPVQLSRRQSELVGLLVQGLKNKEIASALGISEGTVKAYLTTLYEKVGARDRFELALFGLKNLGELRAAASGARMNGETLRSLLAPRTAPRATPLPSARAARRIEA